VPLELPPQPVASGGERSGPRRGRLRPLLPRRLRPGAPAATPARGSSHLHSNQRHGLPAPDSGVVFADGTDAADETSKTCIDVCAEFAGQQDCQTRCVRCAPVPLQLRRTAEPRRAGTRRTRSTRAGKRAKPPSAPPATGCERLSPSGRERTGESRISTKRSAERAIRRPSRPLRRAAPRTTRCACNTWTAPAQTPARASAD